MEDKAIVIFGAGKVGQEASRVLEKEVKYYIDNNPNIWGNKINNVEIISLEKYLELKLEYDIVIACNLRAQLEIEQQLKENDITNYTLYRKFSMSDKQRLISYCMPTELEDVILYHLFKDKDDIFYIDVGSNDPLAGSVTKMLYDMKNAFGINIEPQKKMYDITCAERPNDINIQVGLGAENGKMKLYQQGGCSTIVDDNILSEKVSYEEIDIITLKAICEKYCKDVKEITFLKIDVEGVEKAVLQGADFSRYRPYIIIMESTKPLTDISNYDEWEDILIDNNYHFAYQRGVNRYYVADEKKEYDSLFADMDNIENMYNIYHIYLEM